jgi:hypothetical protein
LVAPSRKRDDPAGTSSTIPDPIDPAEAGRPVQQAQRIIDEASDIDERLLRSPNKEARRHPDLKEALGGPRHQHLAEALERRQREGPIRRRSGGGKGEDIHCCELSSAGYMALLRPSA